jgi:pimeloyl-ACP methyl ester carboxylesterase
LLTFLQMSLPGRFLDIGGQRVFYHRSGRGRPLVLLHGFMVSHWAWRHVIPALAAEHDVIALDLLGFGESDRPADFRYDAPAQMDAVLAALDALGIERAALMGHSMGGAIALYTAARRPERVERLVIVNSLVYPYRVPFTGQVILLPYVGPYLFRGMTKAIVRSYMTNRVYRDPALVTDEWVDYVWERVNRPGGMDAAHAALRFCSDPTLIARSVRAVRAPTLVVWGEGDRMFPLAHGKRLAADITGAQLVVVPECGHAPPEEKPEAFAAAVAPFLAGGERKRMAAVPS